MKRFTNVDSPCFKSDSIQMAVRGNQNINDIYDDGAFLINTTRSTKMLTE